jgi:hypothetical protein
MPNVGRADGPAAISSPPSTWRPFGAFSMRFALPAQTSPLIAATTRWPSALRRKAIEVVRSRPATRSFEMAASNEISGRKGSIVTTWTFWLPFDVVIEPQSWVTPGATGAKPNETYGEVTSARTDGVESGRAVRAPAATVTAAARATSARGGVGMGAASVRRRGVAAMVLPPLPFVFGSVGDGDPERRRSPALTPANALTRGFREARWPPRPRAAAAPPVAPSGVM